MKNETFKNFLNNPELIFKKFSLPNRVDELDWSIREDVITALKFNLTKLFKDDIKQEIENGFSINIGIFGVPNSAKNYLARKIAEFIKDQDTKINKRNIKVHNYYSEEKKLKYIEEAFKGNNMSIYGDIINDLENCNTGDIFIIPNLVSMGVNRINNLKKLTNILKTGRMIEIKTIMTYNYKPSIKNFGDTFNFVLETAGISKKKKIRSILYLLDVEKYFIKLENGEKRLITNKKWNPIGHIIL